MERINHTPITERITKFLYGLVTPFRGEAPDYMSNHYRPSAQRDVGKSASEAAGVQLVIQGMQLEPQLQLERTDVAHQEFLQITNRGWDSEGNYHG